MHADVVSICRDLLRIDTSNPGATEARAAAYVADRLEAVGVPSEVIEPAPGRCSLVARHRGAEHHPGLLVHGHLDVVPADEPGWTHHPFGGVEADGCLWGRGAVDMKNVVAIMLATQLSLAGSGRTPRRDLTFAYFADEETGGGLGSQWAVAHRPELFAGVGQAVGELGGFSVTLPGGPRVYALQTAERGLVWLRIEVPGGGGHAALSDAPNPVVRLARLVERVAALRLDGPPHAAFALLVRRLDELAGGGSATGESVLRELGAFGRITLRSRDASITPTVVRAGHAINVVPDGAELLVDCRFLPGQRDMVLAAVRSTLEDDMICSVVTEMPGHEAPPDGPFPAACQRMIDEHDPGASVVPWVAPAGSDAQRIGALGIECYGFTPLLLDAGNDHLERFHAVDERIPVDTLRRGHQMFEALVSRY